MTTTNDTTDEADIDPVIEEYAETGNKTIGGEGHMVPEIKVSGMNYVSVTARVPADADLREIRRALQSADGHPAETDIKGSDY